MRNSITLFCFVAVPLFTFLAYRRWEKLIRSQLPAWRNLLGLSSMSMVSATWLFWVVLFALGSTGASLPSFINQAWLFVFSYSGLVAALLAMALRGVPRTLAMSAGLLVWAGLQAFGYT